MSTTTELKSKWDELKAQVCERWAEITESDFAEVQGKTDRLIRLIEEKTGTTRRVIEEFLGNTVKGGESVVHSATDKVRDYANKATNIARGTYEEFNTQVEAGFEEARAALRSSPGMSVVVAFGAGVVAGALLSVLLRADRGTRN